MANPIYVYCRSLDLITYAQLEDFMGHMGFLDEPARFDPPLDDANRSNPSWRAFVVHFGNGTKPLTVRRWTTADQIQPSLDELRDRLGNEPPSSAVEAIRRHVEEVRQIFVLDVPNEVTQDVWEMLDATETFIAGRCDGVIVADEGVYGARLEPMLTWTV